MAIELEKQIQFIQVPIPLLEKVLSPVEDEYRTGIREILVNAIYNLGRKVSENRNNNFDETELSNCVKWIIHDCSLKNDLGQQIFISIPNPVKLAINYSVLECCSLDVNIEDVDDKYIMNDFDTSFERYSYSDNDFGTHFLSYLRYLFKDIDKEINNYIGYVILYTSIRLIIKNNSKVLSSLDKPIGIGAVNYILKEGSAIKHRLSGIDKHASPSVNIERIIDLYNFDTGVKRPSVKETTKYKSQKIMRYALVIACFFKCVLGQKEKINNEVKYTYKQYIFDRLQKQGLSSESLLDLKTVCFHDDRNWKKTTEYIMDKYGIYYYAKPNVKYMYIGYSQVLNSFTEVQKNQDVTRFINSSKNLINKIESKNTMSSRMKALS